MRSHDYPQERHVAYRGPFVGLSCGRAVSDSADYSSSQMHSSPWLSLKERRK
jgi:hypothetical protein